MSEGKVPNAVNAFAGMRYRHGTERSGPMSDRPARSPEDAGILLERVRKNLRVGAVFLAEDRVVQRTSKPGPRRVLIIGGAVPLDEPAEITLTRNVQVVSRISVKPWFIEKHGRPGANMLKWAERLATSTPYLLFTPAGLVEGFDKDGYFELTLRRPYPVRELVKCPLLGWLPTPYVTWARVRSGAMLDDPYPPVSE